MRTPRALILFLGLALVGSGFTSPSWAKDKAATATTTTTERKLPFSSVAETVDEHGFIHTNKNGSVQKFIVTDKTVVQNGPMAAKWSDVKAGDQISGSRLRRGENEWEVIHVTHFGPPKPKAPKTAEEER